MPAEKSENTKEKARRRYFTRRNSLIGAGLIAVVLVLLALFSVVSYRYGVFDTYIKNQFVAKMADIGIVFDADVFRVTVNPLALELKNATFNDRVSGEKLFFVRDAQLELRVVDLWAWQLSRDISIEKTEVNGAEVWVKFDEEGRSNFSNLTLVEDEAGSAVNFKYESINFVLRDSVVHFGDLSRKIGGEARNVTFLLSPENIEIPEEERRYKFDLSSTDSSFIYDTRSVDDIDLRVQGIADYRGADFTNFELRTPIGETTMSGRLTDWAAPKYDFDVQSSVDLTQASSILPLGTQLVGVGNFRGKVIGEGENYRVEGEADTASLRADGVSLKGVNVAATVSGTASNYEATGTAIAEMLTFEDFRLDFLKLRGNVRGTGTDFRWVGDLQAAAAKKGNLGLGGLFLSDAVAELKDRELTATVGNGRAQRFAIGDVVLEQLAARNLRLAFANERLTLTAPSATAKTFTRPDIALRGVNSGAIEVRDQPGRTDVRIKNLTASGAAIDDRELKGLSASEFTLTDYPTSTDLTATNLRAAEWSIDRATRVQGIEVPFVELRDTAAETIVDAKTLRLAKVDTGAAILGSLNIAGVRLTIRQGYIRATSNDIEAGAVTLAKTTDLPSGGTLEGVFIKSPVYEVEPSGRYRATADLTIGGGALGSVSLGAARAKLDATRDRIAVNDISGSAMGGTVEGSAVIASGRGTSTVKAGFTNLDVGQLLTLAGGRVVPLEGQTSGNVDLEFTGTNFKDANGTINAGITASAGAATGNEIPVTGDVRLRAVNGLFNVELADLKSNNTTLSATGRADFGGDASDLKLALNTTDASEIDRLVRALAISDTLEEQLDSFQVQLAGNLKFDGTVAGNLSDPIVEGNAALDSLILRGRNVGSVSTDIAVSPAIIELKNGKLQEAGGGTIAFNVKVPSGVQNQTEVSAELTNVNAGNLLSALPIDLPEQLRNFTGQTSGRVDIKGLPNNAQGFVDIASTSGTVAGQNFDGLNVRANFAGTRIDLERVSMKLSGGELTAKGFYDRADDRFDLDIEGKQIPAGLLVALAPDPTSLPTITGTLNFGGKAIGTYGQAATYNVNFSGSSPDLLINQTAVGQLAFNGQTVNNVLTANLTATVGQNAQVINATVDFRSDDLPFTVKTDFNQTSLAPYLAFVPQLSELKIAGDATGTVEVSGNLSKLENGKRVFTADDLSGTARFERLALQLDDTPLVSQEPVVVRFNMREINFDRARFGGGGSNVTIAGTKALTKDGINDLSIEGRVNLTLLNLASIDDTFFAGFADTSIRLSGPNSTARLSGQANIVNGSVATFLGSDRFTLDRVNARLIFTTSQVEIERAEGYLGGGKFTASGGGVIGPALSLQAFRLAIDGNNVTVPLPQDFVTTGDAQLEISGQTPPNGSLQLLIAGRIQAERSIYSKDIDLASIVSGRESPTLGAGGSSLNPPQFDLVIEGRDALIVRNNIADLVASISLTLTGDANEPRIAGRITANRGTILFRKDRYEVQRGVLEFPPDTGIEPIINLQAEAEIAGYQVFVSLAGPLRDSEQLTATLRSNPALPQADVVSLVTTGNLSNTAGGIPTLAQTGINTAAEVLTDAIINAPIRRATDRLFGLNVFEIDPLVAGTTTRPGARLTVGRQINNNLRVTYSTNLSQDQNQVLALEYRVSSKLSVVAQYEQASLSNVTRKRDNFSFEVRFRRRF